MQVSANAYTCPPAPNSAIPTPSTSTSSLRRRASSLVVATGIQVMSDAFPRFRRANTRCANVRAPNSHDSDGGGRQFRRYVAVVQALGVGESHLGGPADQL